ncbi:MAG: hypothetical protein JWO78_1471 [Micavibrio sp.]|nr:hypothetical protein [Micavibrio sp.]
MRKRDTTGDFITITPGGPTKGIQLSGSWTINSAALIETEIADFQKSTKDSAISVDPSGIRELDTVGAWLIKKHFGHAPGIGPLIESRKNLFDFLPGKMEARTAPSKPSSIFHFFSHIGKTAIDRLNFLYAIFVFIGKIFSRLLSNFLSPRRFRFPSIVRHIYETGIQAVPIIALLGILMSMVISYQAAIQLQKFGADIFTIDLSVISILREMGVLITAIMVAGRSGSAFAAEIGVMKMREEVDALKTIGMDPIEVLVLPRVIALILVLPMLTFIADIVGLAGGSLMSLLLLDIPLHQYLDRAQTVATPTMFAVGMIKAPVFAFLISVIGTYQGMNVTGSAESVGKLTTVSVVQSIFLVIMADAAFSVIFSRAGI